MAEEREHWDGAHSQSGTGSHVSSGGLYSVTYLVLGLQLVFDRVEAVVILRLLDCCPSPV